MLFHHTHTLTPPVKFGGEILAPIMGTLTPPPQKVSLQPVPLLWSVALSAEATHKQNVEF